MRVDIIVDDILAHLVLSVPIYIETLWVGLMVPSNGAERRVIMIQL